MKLIELTTLAKRFDLTKDDCYKLILNHSNKIGIKLMHSFEQKIVVPEILLDSILKTVESIENSLIPYSTISYNKNHEIPFKRDGYVYYLFENGKLIYIGQTINITGRISQHISDGKVFDRVSLVQTEPRNLLLTERFYIYRDLPSLNISVMSSLDYFHEILDITDLDDLNID